ncbi:hypothetical protein KFE80_00365 [bacterium SCSIO 12696]|nr:hypothetical protein KFE80_00365 [bacterium SCSIO 12696]
MKFKSLFISACIWVSVTFVVAFFIAALIGGRGGEIILFFGFVPGLVGWGVHIGFIKYKKSIATFPTAQPLLYGLVSLSVTSLIVTLMGSPKPIYAAAAMIFMFGSLPALVAAYLAHWALLKLNSGAKNA